MGTGSEQEQGNGGPPRVHHGGPPSYAELQRRFTYQKPRDQKAVSAHEEVSKRTFQLALELCDICPPGRNLSLALTALEDVRMRANAAIAVDDPRP